MFTTIKATALSALIGLGAMAALPAAAQADNLYLGFGSGGAQLGVDIGDRYDGYRYDDYRRPVRHYRGCTPDRAIDKAWRMGLRNPRVVDVDRRTIEVRGHRRGHRVHVLFARAPHCPVIR